jgi:hypothetical protein
MRVVEITLSLSVSHKERARMCPREAPRSIRPAPNKARVIGAALPLPAQIEAGTPRRGGPFPARQKIDVERLARAVTNKTSNDLCRHMRGQLPQMTFESGAAFVVKIPSTCAVETQNEQSTAGA